MLWFRSLSNNNFLGYRCKNNFVIDNILELPKINKYQNLSKEEKENFSEIYLCFDYDIHHYFFTGENNPNELNRQLLEMLNYFNDETGDRGNYILIVLW